MMNIAEALEELFRQKNWKYQKIDKGVYAFRLWGKNDRYHLGAYIDDSFFLSIMAYPTSIAPREKLALVAEFLLGVNFKLKIGSFMLDFGSGETIFRTTVELTNDHVEPEVIDRMISRTIFAVDTFTPGLLALIYSDITPAQAIKIAEKKGLET